jgi:CSLREA domain-containing protein
MTVFAPYRRSCWSLMITVCAGAALALSSITTPYAHGATMFNVNSTADDPDADRGNGVCATSGGACTLRAAIEETNALVGTDSVNVPAGTYNVTARLDIEDNLNLTGAGATSTLLDGGGAHPVLHVKTVEYLVCDSAHNRVWSYDRNGQQKGSFSSPGAGGLKLPVAAHIGPNGHLYVTGFSSGVHRFNGNTGDHEAVVAALGAGGLVSPVDAVFGPSNTGNQNTDDLFVADYNFPTKGILRYKGQTGASLGTFAAPGVGGLGNPDSLVFKNGELFATSTINSAVLRFNGTTGALVGAFVPSFSGGLNTPRGLLFAPDGSLLVASWGNDRILRYNGTTGAFIGQLVGAGSGGLDRPTDLALGPDGSLLVTSSATRQVLRYNMATGAFLGVFIQGGSPVDLDTPSCIVPRVGMGSGPLVIISGVTLQNGSQIAGDRGAGLLNDLGALTTLRDARVRDNHSSTFGGGISNSGNLDIFRTEITGNELPPGGGGQTSQGGGVFNIGDLDIEQSLIANNFATRGGGISNTNEGSIEILNSTISGNKALGGGGGIRNVANGQIDIAFTTITGNRANEPGGAGEANRQGGGIQNLSPARVSIGGSIIAGNIDNRTRFQTEFAPDCWAPTNSTTTSHRSNLVGVLNPNCAMRDAISGGAPTQDQFGSATAPLSPKLGPLALNGGNTQTHALLPGSPAIDSKKFGTNSVFFDCQARDQRDKPRPIDGDGNGTAVCDIGAFERGP